MKARYLVASAALAFLCSPALAQNLKPGLWEVGNKMQTESGEMEKSMAQMQQQMAKMTPEQRKMMEDAMAKHGTKMGAGGPPGSNIRVCITRDMAERNDFSSPQGDCKTTNQARTGNTMKVAFTCTNPPSSGEGQITFVSPEAYTTRMAITTTMRGKPEKMNVEGSGKWIAADCGDVKPRGR